MSDRYAEKSRRDMVLNGVSDAVADMLSYNRDDDPELLEPDGVEAALNVGEVTIEEMGEAFMAALRKQLK